MVFDRIENLRKYASYMPAVNEVCDFLDRNDVKKLEAGRHDISDNVYVNVQIYEPKTNDAYEDHRKYIDLQYIVEGSEEIDVIPKKDGTDEGEYVEEYDCSVFHGTKGSVVKLFMDEGTFTILEPDDPHCPGIAWKGGQVRKLIFKIKVQG